MNTFRIIAILIVCLMLGYRLTAQTCDHDSNKLARFQAMRILPPSKIYWDGVTVTATYNEGTEILTTDKNSILHIPADYKSKQFWIIKDLCSGYAYVVDEIAPAQMRKK
jgi:hypothetical protein